MTDVPLCEVCGTYTRDDLTLCPSCWAVTQPTCQCGHGKHLHWPDSCASLGYWDAIKQQRVGCACTGFKEAA